MPARPSRRTTATHHPQLSLGRRVAIRTLVSYLITFAILRVITAIIAFNIFPNGPNVRAPERPDVCSRSWK
jgi:hypothetical protein